MKHRNPAYLWLIQRLSWLITLVFLAALLWAIYQAVIDGNPLPIWAWLGVLTLFAVAVGLVVTVLVYRGVVSEVGPFDFRSSARVTGQLKNVSRRIDAGGASSLRASIHMTQGILQLTGGSAGVMEAEFTYDDADWKPPDVGYAVDASGRGDLEVEQKATGRPTMHQGRCEWVVHLNQDIPTELNVRFGAGKADLKLGGLSLERFRVDSGVGELNLDLRGEWQQSLEAYVKVGIGDATLHLPQGVGVRVQTTVGFGSTQPHGLTWDGEAYTTDLYGTATVNLDITIEGGMGKLTLEQAA